MSGICRASFLALAAKNEITTYDIALHRVIGLFNIYMASVFSIAIPKATTEKLRATNHKKKSQRNPRYYVYRHYEITFL